MEISIGAQEHEWWRLYNIAPETAAKIAADFSPGLLSLETLALIDLPALAREVRRDAHLH